MRAVVALRWVLRESRGSRARMLFFIACLAVGVAAVVGTASLSAAVDEGFRSQSRAILGGDLSVDARRPLPDDLAALLARHPGAERTDVVEAMSMASVPGPDGRPLRTRLVQVHAISGRYPLYGTMRTEPPGGPAAWFSAETVVASRVALEELGLAVGDDVRVGAATYRIAAVAVTEPPQFGLTALTGPRIYMDRDALRRSGLMGFGVRSRYKALVSLPGDPSPQELKALSDEILALPGGEYLDVDLHHESGPLGGRTSRRVRGFIGLAALLSMVVGGIGVAQIVRTWLESRTRSVAVMRCLGARPREIVAIWLGHTMLLAVAGSVLGAAAGSAVPWIAGTLAPGLVPEGVSLAPSILPALRGLVLGPALALVFALPPLTAIWRVSPARVLRSDAAPLRAPRVVSVSAALAVLGGLLGAAWVQSRDVRLSVGFTVGFAVLAALLFVAAVVVTRVIRRVPRLRLPTWLRHGVSALVRPGAGTAPSIVALGLGTMVVVSMVLVESRMREILLAQVPPNAPSVYVMSVRPEHRDGVRAALDAARAAHVVDVPVVQARIVAVDGRPVAEILAEPGRRGGSGGALRREHRLTALATLDPSNRIVAGALWSDPARDEVSLDERYARELGVAIGARLSFDVQGTQRDLVVTSLRSVDWQSLSINFSFVAEPGSVGDATAPRIFSARVGRGDEAALQDAIVAAAPGASLLRVGAILDEVTALVHRAATGVAVLGAFTVVSGLLVLAGTASASGLRRRREVALLKTLGATRAHVAASLAAEYGMVGFVAGLVGSCGAIGLADGFLRFVVERPVDLPWSVVPVAALCAGAAAAVAGLAASVRTLGARPIEALR